MQAALSGQQMVSMPYPTRQSTMRGNMVKTSAATGIATVKPSPGARLEMECSRLAIEGKGVCLLPPSNFVILCTRALPGERLVAEITAVKKGYAEAYKVQTLAPHFDAVAPACSHFGPCGGCTLQSLAYPAQLREKQNQVSQTLKRVGKLDGVDAAMQPILGCDPSLNDSAMPSRAGLDVSNDTSNSAGSTSSTMHNQSGPKIGRGIYGYRNKMQFTFSNVCWEPNEVLAGPRTSTPESHSGGRTVSRPVLGFLRPGSQQEVLPISKCWLQDDTSNTILEVVRRIALDELQLKPYNHPSGKGSLKHLVIRSARPAPQQQLHVHQTAEAPSCGSEVDLQVPGQSPGSQRHYSKVADPQRSGSQGQKEYLVTIVVTSSTSVDALQPLADALVAHVPQVVGVVVKVFGVLRPESKQDERASKLQKKPVAKAHKLARTKQPSQRPQQEEMLPRPDGQKQSGCPPGIHLLAGARPFLIETIRGLQLRVSPDSFLQTNTAQTEVLYKAISDAAQLRSTETLLDLYCGAGSIGLSLAHQCAHVVGYEAVGAAVTDARHNASVNGVCNASFACVDLAAGVPDPAEWAGIEAGIEHGAVGSVSAEGKVVQGSQGGGRSMACTDPAGAAGLQAPMDAEGRALDNMGVSVSPGGYSTAGSGLGGAARAAWLAPDVIVCDPARAGLSAAVVAYIRASTARRCIYVSCNPATQARDLALLCGVTHTKAAGSRSAIKQTSKRAGNLMRNAGSQQMEQPGSQLESSVHMQDGSRSMQGAVFQLVSLQAVDMFPHTDHVETVAVLERVGLPASLAFS